MPLTKKISIAFSSLWLFFVLFAVREFDFNSFNAGSLSLWELLLSNMLTIANLILAMVGLVIVYCLRCNWSVPGDHGKKLVSVKSKNADFLIFTPVFAMLLLPFDASDITQLLTVIAVIISFGFILVRTDIYYVNPGLALFGYRLYEVGYELKEKSSNSVIIESVSVLSFTSLKKGDVIRLQAYDDNVDMISIAKRWKKA